MLVRINLGMANSMAYGLGFLELTPLLQSAVKGSGKVTGSCVKLSSGGDWDPESILLAEIDVDDIERFNEALVALCVVLNEDSIAVSMLGDEGYLVFNPNYTGEKYDFNIDYFTQ